MRYEVAYNKAVEILNRDTALLFQRLNFFLIATAFLIAAFATVLTVGTGSILLNIDYILSAAGFVYSLLLAATNYLNTRIIWQIGEYIRNLEDKDFGDVVEQGQEPYKRIDQIVKGSMNRRTTFSLIPSMVGSVFTVIGNPSKTARESVADHTYIVPLLFVVVWLALFVFLLCWN